MKIVVQGMESHVKDKMSGDHWELCQINIGKQPCLQIFFNRNRTLQIISEIQSWKHEPCLKIIVMNKNKAEKYAKVNIH
jgi:hypothetical protein